MRILNHAQRSPEWHEARLGVPTASQFGKLITPTGKMSAQAETVINQCIAELVTGKPTEVFVTAAMQRGTDLEPEARDFYSVVYSNQPVTEVGLCLHDKYQFGASPDALVGEDGLLEIKCQNPATLVGWHRENSGCPPEHLPQIMGQLLVTNRLWCDLLGYHPDMKPYMCRVMRDDEYIAKLFDVLIDVCIKIENGFEMVKL